MDIKLVTLAGHECSLRGWGWRGAPGQGWSLGLLGPVLGHELVEAFVVGRVGCVGAWEAAAVVVTVEDVAGHGGGESVVDAEAVVLQ